MLNLEWYADLMHQRHAVSMPAPVTWDNSFRPADSVIASWRAASVSGAFARPLAFAMTVSLANIPDGAGALQLAGPYRRLIKIELAALPDTASMRLSLEGVLAADFTGATTSPTDRSAVRTASNPHFPAHVVYVATMYAHALAEGGRVAEVFEAVQWAEQFATEAGVADEVSERINDVRESIDELLIVGETQM